LPEGRILVQDSWMKSSLALVVTATLCVAGADCSGRVSDETPKATADAAPPPARSAEPTPGVFSLKSPYAQGAAPSFTSANCNLETINGASFGSTRVPVEHSAPLVIGGWGYDDNTKGPAKSLTVVLLDSLNRLRYFGTGAESRRRPDVGAYLHLPDLVNLGFEATLSLVQVEPGTYRVLLGIERAADVTYCDVGRQIVVQ
jgi:hypothetical protein